MGGLTALLETSDLMTMIIVANRQALLIETSLKTPMAVLVSSKIVEGLKNSLSHTREKHAEFKYDSQIGILVGDRPVIEVPNLTCDIAFTPVVNLKEAGS